MSAITELFNYMVNDVKKLHKNNRIIRIKYIENVTSYCLSPCEGLVKRVNQKSVTLVNRFGRTIRVKWENISDWDDCGNLNDHPNIKKLLKIA